jgi:hypothetical protein
MAKHVIREVKVDPPVPSTLIVFRRDDIARFVETARRTVAQLEAELAARAHHPVADPPSKSPLFSLPPWTARIDDEADNITFFESLRDDDEQLIAGA